MQRLLRYFRYSEANMRRALKYVKKMEEQKEISHQDLVQVQQTFDRVDALSSELFYRIGRLMKFHSRSIRHESTNIS